MSPLEFENSGILNLVRHDLIIKDVSSEEKFGIKGKGSIEFLTQNGFAIPEKYNSAIIDKNVKILRLGITEFLLEGAGVQALYDKQSAGNAYKVLRQDCCILLSGEAIYKILSQSCAINFVIENPRELQLFLTTMIGVSVTILLQEKEGVPQVRIYCDPTYGAYLFKTLIEIAT